MREKQDISTLLHLLFLPLAEEEVERIDQMFMYLILRLYFGTGERKVDRCKGDKRTIYLRCFT